MARLMQRVPCFECPHMVPNHSDQQVCDNDNGDCPQKSAVETGKYQDGTPYVIWDEDLDTIILTVQELNTLANLLGHHLVKN